MPLSYRILTLYGSQTGNAESIAKNVYGVIHDNITAGAYFKHPHAHSGDCTDQSDWTVTAECYSMNEYVTRHGPTSMDQLVAPHTLLIAVISTTGNGDLPDNATKFYRQLRQKRLAKQAAKTANDNSTDNGNNNTPDSFYYSVLGLGDTNYDKFAESGKRVDSELSFLGTPLLPKCLADDATGLEAVVEPWKEKVLDAVKVHLQAQYEQCVAAQQSSPQTPGVETTPTAEPAASTPVTDSAATAAPIATATTPTDSTAATPVVTVEKPTGLARLHKCELSVTVKSTADTTSYDYNAYFQQRWHALSCEDATLKGYTADTPFMAKLVAARYLTTAKAHNSSDSRRVIHLELALPSATTDAVLYQAGDAIGVYAPNQLKLALALCQRLKLQPTQVVHFHAKDAKSENHNHPVSSTEVPTAATTHTAPDHPAPIAMAASVTASSHPALSHIRSPCRIIDIFVYCCDLTSVPRKTFLRMLAEYCSDATDKTALYQLASRAGATAFQQQMVDAHPNLLDILQAYPSCMPPLDHLVQELPPLMPRYYSLTCSPLLYPTHMQIAFTVVLHNSQHAVATSESDAVHKGVCTSWLEELCAESSLLRCDFPLHSSVPTSVALPGANRVNGAVYIPVFLRRSLDFVLPEDMSRPVIMVGAGTGVAPFRGFLQHRKYQLQAMKCGGVASGWWRGLQMELAENDPSSPSVAPPANAAAVSNGSTAASKPSSVAALGRYAATEDEDDDVDPDCMVKRGEMVLFFGCRREDEDYLYGSEFKEMVSEGILDELHVAFSRLTEEKVYVQHRIREQAARLVPLILHRSAHIFVCGDGSAMSKAVMTAFQDILVSALGDQQAKAYVFNMIKEKRYVQDIWS